MIVIIICVFFLLAAENTVKTSWTMRNPEFPPYLHGSPYNIIILCSTRKKFVLMKKKNFKKTVPDIKRFRFVKLDTEFS